jgi:hypothetical protein
MARRCPAPPTHGQYHGITYRFASAAHRDAFSRRPGEISAAKYGGYCAFAMAKGGSAKTDPEAFTVIGGKLYLNFNEGVRQPLAPIASTRVSSIAADLNWPQVPGGSSTWYEYPLAVLAHIATFCFVHGADRLTAIRTNRFESPVNPSFKIHTGQTFAISRHWFRHCVDFRKLCPRFFIEGSASLFLVCANPIA